jgi:hypothetical protein
MSVPIVLIVLTIYIKNREDIYAAEAIEGHLFRTPRTFFFSSLYSSLKSMVYKMFRLGLYLQLA